MTNGVLRDRLITYLSVAGDSELKEVYALLKGHIHLEHLPPSFSQEQLSILNERREDLLSGLDRGIDRVELHNNVRRA